jgi:hypothetical protein
MKLFSWNKVFTCKPQASPASKNTIVQPQKYQKPLDSFDLAVIEQEKRQAAHEAQRQAEQKAREEKLAKLRQEAKESLAPVLAQSQKLKEGRYNEYMKKTPDLPIIYWLQGKGWGWRGRNPD